MAGKPFLLEQDLYLESSISPPLVTVVHFLNPWIIHRLEALVTQPVLGLAISLDAQCRICRLAIASPTAIISIPLSVTNSANRKVLQRVFLSQTVKVAVKMDILVSSLLLDHQCHLSNRIDLLSTVNEPRASFSAFRALFSEKGICNSALSRLYREYEAGFSGKLQGSCLLAWAACRVAMRKAFPFALAPRISTQLLDASELRAIAKSIQIAHRLDKLKPHFTQHEVEETICDRSKTLRVRCTRYKTRIGTSSKSKMVEIGLSSPDGRPRIVKGAVGRVNGRTVNLLMQGHIIADAIQSVKTIGREAPTIAESSRDSLLLSALQGQVKLFASPFSCALWTPEGPIFWKNTLALPKTTVRYRPSLLNASQLQAVRAVIHPTRHRIVLIHGPPGTGKTTVIAAIVNSIVSCHDHSTAIALVAQSNTAVKNIAERLIRSDFNDFKILVSRDFHYDWHEHLYEKMERNLICSDEFDSPNCTLSGARVVLCTLSMLSNPMAASLIQEAPPNLIIFDEASQINAIDYFPMLQQFQGSIRKLVFIGDDEQLPPYGFQEIPALHSVFELRHLRSNSLFLDTQYRMPAPIGHFISEHIYNNKLKTQHQITRASCCKFIDVCRGREELRGQSWVNKAEAKVVAKLAQTLHQLGWTYRIITPYDAQRSFLENSLRGENIPWQDRCYNIDSFQGHESDYIIISVVRSNKLGFLQNIRRLNVMLTRCKKGMIICTNQNFMETVAVETLLGKLANWISKSGSSCWIDEQTVITSPDTVLVDM